jgi:hypothetical protein
MNDLKKPDYVTDEHLDFLDELMASGMMTSFKVTQILMHRFPKLSFDQVSNILTYWIYTYNYRHDLDE